MRAVARAHVRASEDKPSAAHRVMMKLEGVDYEAAFVCIWRPIPGAEFGAFGGLLSSREAWARPCGATRLLFSGAARQPGQAVAGPHTALQSSWVFALLATPFSHIFHVGRAVIVQLGVCCDELKLDGSELAQRSSPVPDRTHHTRARRHHRRESPASSRDDVYCTP